jgi:hypothetical protein
MDEDRGLTGYQWFFIAITTVFIMWFGSLAAMAKPLTCDYVRYYVQQYGESNVVAFARQHGYSKKQIAQARKCLRHR